MSAVIATTGLVAGYERDLPIVKGIDFSLTKGEFVAIFGPNGAGKSTFVKALAGVVPIFGGTAELDGASIVGLKPHAILKRGMAFVPQTENIFTTLSIRENLQLAAAPLAKGGQAAAIARMFDMFPDLARETGRSAGSLSGGQRQMLAVARALLLEPSVLVLDEPSAGLSPKLVSDVFETLKRISESGVTILLVEQNVRAALRIVERGVVLVDGRLRFDAPAQALSDHPDLGALFLGLDHARERAAS
ncbi:ABC transporter ATP-binding protein [Mesorhizobium sp. CAU 1732]|uniref:ABC transporter ATP-binding protein n=1 Tax=Mesorhizobium sp. CAU 1732 TaxID=3140358 RepID=UPI003260203B